MADLKTSAERLLDAVSALETNLAAERAAALKTARHARRFRKQMIAQTQSFEAATATVAERDATIAKLNEDLLNAQGDTAALDSLRAALQTAEAERDALREEASNASGDPEAFAAVELARDQAIAAAEEIAAERDEALNRIAELETARTGDAKLREEAAEALDAAIGELKTMSGGAANG